MHPGRAERLLDLSLQVAELLRLPAVPGRARELRRKDVLCDDDEQKNFKAKYNKKLPCTGEEIDAIDWDDVQECRRVLPAQEGRDAGRQACSTTISTASPSRPARATTSRRCRSTASSGSMAATSGTRPRRPNGQAEGVVNSPEAVEGTGALSELARSTCRRWSRPAPWTSSSRTSCSVKARWP